MTDNNSLEILDINGAVEQAGSLGFDVERYSADEMAVIMHLASEAVGTEVDGVSIKPTQRDLMASTATVLAIAEVMPEVVSSLHRSESSSASGVMDIDTPVDSGSTEIHDAIRALVARNVTDLSDIIGVSDEGILSDDSDSTTRVLGLLRKAIEQIDHESSRTIYGDLILSSDQIEIDAGSFEEDDEDDDNEDDEDDFVNKNNTEEDGDDEETTIF